MSAAADDLDVTLDALRRAFAENAAALDAGDQFPFDNLRRLRDSGLTALVAPRNCGGRGQGLSAAFAAVREISRGEASTGLILAQNYIFHAQMRGGRQFPEEICEKIFRQAAERGSFGNHLRVEPDLGTPLRGGLPATIARRTSGGYELSGHKIYATGAPDLDFLAIYARTDEDAPRCGAFLVEGGAPGLAIVESWRHSGMRASGSHDVILDEVFVADSHVGLLRSLESPRRAPEEQAWIAVLFAAVYHGAALAARDWLTSFLRARKPSNLGAPLAELPRMQAIVGEIDAALYAAETLLADVAEKTDRGAPPPVEHSGYAKHMANRLALEAADKALAAAGNPGLSRDNPLERHYRDILCARVHSPQADTVFLNGGRAALA